METDILIGKRIFLSKKYQFKCTHYRISLFKGVTIR